MSVISRETPALSVSTIGVWVYHGKLVEASLMSLKVLRGLPLDQVYNARILSADVHCSVSKVRIQAPIIITTCVHMQLVSELSASLHPCP